ncbi:lambda-exonuclease family protein [Pseudomonas fluorescens]|uniref:lambda-exonuclease family protein n=1 Tax=Pseudomonas fluorescens TaxID=294 RepID=UPI003D03973E
MTATPLSSTSKPRPALRLISTKELPREDWLAVRKQGIGSSDAGVAVGLNPYKSQLELWMEKTGRDTTLPKADPHDEESPMYWGNVLELRLRGKSTRQSHGTPIFYVDLTVRTGMDMAESLQAASELDTQRQGSGFDQAALDEAASRGFGNGAFEDSEEDAGAVIEEFYSITDTTIQGEVLQPATTSLAGKLEALISSAN